jgi:4-hydroxybenzoate polyprenyltransferase
MSLVRTLLLIGRAANLPGVWSNCLVGWWLGGGGRLRGLIFLLLGASALYSGAAALNDVYDLPFDRDHRRTRPIVTGAIDEELAWRFGCLGMMFGVVLLAGAGWFALALGLVIALASIVYNGVHRLVPASPALLGFCRFCLYLMGASTAEFWGMGWPIWCGLALAAYVAGVGCFRRWERATWSVNYWPVLLLLTPIWLAFLFNGPDFRVQMWELSAMVGLLILLALRMTFWSRERNLAQGVARLQAGIILVDWLAAADASKPFSGILVGLFVLTLALQRVVPE